MHKEMAYNRDIPHSSSLCEVCENASFSVKGINSNLKSSDILSPTAQDLIEEHKCDSSSKDCMTGNCPDCLKAGLSLSDFKADVDLIYFLQWQRAEKKIVKVNQAMPLGQVIPKWVKTTRNLKRYIYTQQDEIQSAYFGQQNFNIFTSCPYCCEAEQGDLAKTPIAVISESSDHSRIATFTCTNTIVNELKKRMKDSLKKSHFVE